MSERNYSVTTEMLQERYGDKQVFFTHERTSELIYRENLNDLKYSIKIYNNIDTQVHSLTSLSMDPDTYGPMLIAAVM